MKKIVILLLTIILGVCETLTVVASDDNDLEFSRTQNEELDTLSITCISVNSKGNIAIGFKNHRINVYNEEGGFVCCYKFKHSSGYAFEYVSNDNILVYPDRSSYYYVYTEDGILVEKIKHGYTVEESQYRTEIGNRKRIEKGGIKYYVDNILGYEKVIVDRGSDSIVIYKMPVSSYTIKIACIILFISFLILTVFFAVKKTVKFYEKKK